MPTMQFVNPNVHPNICVTKNFPAPKKVADVWKGWYKTCLTLSLQVPNIFSGDTTWHCPVDPEIDVRWIKFTIVHKFTGEKVYLIIDRKGPSF